MIVRGLVLVCDDLLIQVVVDEVLVVNFDVVDKICGGKVVVVGVIVGVVMKVICGQVDVV